MDWLDSAPWLPTPTSAILASTLPITASFAETISWTSYKNYLGNLFVAVAIKAAALVSNVITVTEVRVHPKSRLNLTFADFATCHLFSQIKIRVY